MPNSFSIDINKQPFYLAGRKIGGVAFLVGRHWLKISLSNCPVDEDGHVVIQATPQQARNIARELLSYADADQVQQIIKQAKEAVGE